MTHSVLPPTVSSLSAVILRCLDLSMPGIPDHDPATLFRDGAARRHPLQPSSVHPAAPTDLAADPHFPFVDRRLADSNPIAVPMPIHLQ